MPTARCARTAGCSSQLTQPQARTRSNLMLALHERSCRAKATEVKKTGQKRGGRRAKSGNASAPESSTPSSSTTSSTEPEVGYLVAQMTDYWVLQSLPKAVGNALALEIQRKGYARHIFYVPFYLPSAIQHEEALIRGDEHGHDNHHIPLHYTEIEVVKAAKEKQARLDRKQKRA